MSHDSNVNDVCHDRPMVDYPWQMSVGVFPVDWSSQGDEWIHRFTQAMASRSSTSVTGHRYDDTTAPFICVSLGQADTTRDTVVLLAVTTDAVFVLVAGSVAAEEELVNCVASAAEAATRGLGDAAEEISWTAIVGPGPERSSSNERPLKAAVSIGPMRLTSTDVILIEPEVSQQRSLHSWGIQRSIPIRVSGSSRGYNWQSASVHAARDLHTLCGVLSVATDETIIVRETAAPLSWGERVVPESPPWYRAHMDETRDIDVARINAMELPSWSDSAWTRTQREPKLVPALDAYLEGLQAVTRHPSLAAVSFVASAETLASKLFKLKRCESCLNRLGLGYAFKMTLRKVLNEKEALALDSVYNYRSKTVHSGSLHGGETTPGILFLGAWSQDTATDFRWRMLWRLQGATRRLLEWALTTQLPARTLLVPESPEPGDTHSCNPQVSDD